MPNETIKIFLYSALIPNFYTNFRCLAQDCRDTCCSGWRIAFDKKDYLRLRCLDAPAEVKAKLDQCVRRERNGNNDDGFFGKFDLDSNGGRCPLQTSEGLCSLQLACGHKALPGVCMTYPREIGYTPAAKEYALSPSCEGVLQQLWDLPDGVEFVENPLSKVEQRTVNIPRGENLTPHFAPLRSLFIDILQNRAMPLHQRMLLLGIVLQRLQKEDWTNFDPDNWVERMAALTDAGTVKDMIANIAGNRDMYVLQNLHVLDTIAAAGAHWPTQLYNTLGVKQKAEAVSDENGEIGRVAQITTTFSPKAYEDALKQFQASFSDHEYFFENLMVAVSLYLSFPNLSSREALWKSYVSLCNLYSFYHFVSVLSCKEDVSKERLFHMIVMASRATMHNRDRLNGFQEDLFQNESSTLAHMAILLLWN